MCYALFEYLATGGYIQDACNIFETVLMDNNIWVNETSNNHHIFSVQSRLEVSDFNISRKLNTVLHLGSVSEQYLWLLYLKFLNVYVAECNRKKIWNPDNQSQLTPLQCTLSKKHLRMTLTKFLDRFPAHPIGLYLYIRLEQKSHLSTSIRRFFDQRLNQAPSPVTFLFAIYTELLKSGEESHNRIRNLFERALEYQICRTNVMLWRMYIRFEINISHIENARKLFYRAIDKCPYSKLLWLDAAKLFKDNFSADELREIIDLMNEKEIMLRSSIEEIIGQDELTKLFKHQR